MFEEAFKIVKMDMEFNFTFGTLKTKLSIFISRELFRKKVYSTPIFVVKLFLTLEFKHEY